MTVRNVVRKVRWGIAGLGKIAHRFAKDLTHNVTLGELHAVAARDLERASAFAEQYQSPKSYGTYTALAQDPEIDVVYVATIHPLHKSLVALFLAHGKHVLVEKPAFTNTEDWDEMSALAQRQGLLLVEAMKTVTFPAYQALRSFIHDNHITLTSIEASFGNYHEFDPQQPLFNPALSGGATLDVGVYALWLYVDLCQLMQKTLIKPAVTISRDNPTSEVDENVTFHFAGAQHATLPGTLCASITRHLPREAVLKGPDVHIVIREKWWNPCHIEICYQGKEFTIEAPMLGGGFAYEIEHVSSLVQNNAQCSELIPASSSRAVIALMEEALCEHGFSYLARN